MSPDDRDPYTDDDPYPAGIYRPNTGIQPSYIAPGPHNIPPQNRARGGVPGGPGAVKSLDVREINRYPGNLITQGFSLTTVSVLVVSAPATTRIILIMRNAEESAGVAYIGFGQNASTTTSPVSLAIGGTAIFDVVIPQCDMFMAAASTANVVIAYADVPT